MIAKFGRPKIVQFPFKIIFRYCAICPRFSYLQMVITRCIIWHNCTLYTVNYGPDPCKYTMQKYLASHRVAGNNINVTGAAIKLASIHNADAECNVYINHAFNVYEIFYFNPVVSMAPRKPLMSSGSWFIRCIIVRYIYLSAINYDYRSNFHQGQYLPRARVGELTAHFLMHLFY
jgi:hypothetical protein